MNSLLGNLDLALMAQVAPEIREMIGTAKTCGVLLLNLINTVLDAGKLGLGKLEVNPVPTRIHDTLQRCWGISYDLTLSQMMNFFPLHSKDESFEEKNQLEEDC